MFPTRAKPHGVVGERPRPWRVAGVLGAALSLTMLASSAHAQVSSWAWRDSLARSGLNAASAPAIRAAAVDITSPAFTQPPTNVAEPAGTTSYLNSLAQQRALNPTRFDLNHPQLGPLLGEEARIKAGDCTNVNSFNGLLPNTPYYNYYRWTRSLAPQIFDRNHPNLGAALAEDQRVRNLIAQCNAQQQGLEPPTNGGGGTPGGTPGGGGGGGTPAVPEPTSLALILIGTGALIAPRLANHLRKLQQVQAD